MLNAYSSSLKTIGTTALFVTLAGFAGCGNDTPVDSSRNLQAAGSHRPAYCEGLSYQIRHKTLNSLGLKKMSDMMKKISAALSPEERMDLMRFSQDTVHPSLYDGAIDVMKIIYNEAIERSGILAGKSHPLRPIGRKIVAEASNTFLTHPKLSTNGYMILMTSKPLVHTTPKPGDILDAYLVVSPDQTRQEFVLAIVPEVLPGPNGGYTTPEEKQLTLTEYVQSVLPPSCL